MTNAFEWCDEGISSQKSRLQNIPMDTFPWIMKCIRNLKVFHIPNVDDMPPEAEKEQEEFQLESIQSLICVPMVIHDQLMGFLGFDSVRKRKAWTDDLITLLKIVGDIFVSALQRKTFEEEIHQSKEEALAASQSLANQNIRLEKMNWALEEQKRELEKAYQDVDTFAHTVSHDLGAPLRALKNLCQVYPG